MEGGGREGEAGWEDDQVLIYDASRALKKPAGQVAGGPSEYVYAVKKSQTIPEAWKVWMIWQCT